jgi:3-oxoacyl-[acyl-carrier-protein] synthase II
MSLANKRRVVVTGLGLVTPLGLGVKENWANILEGKSSASILKGDGTNT